MESNQALLSGADADGSSHGSTDDGAVGVEGRPKKTASLTRVVLACCASTLCNVAFGYDVGVVSGSLADMASTLKLSTFEQEAATSGLNFVAGFGALLISGNILDRFGRRRTILSASLLLLLGAAVVSCAEGFWMLLVGRALQGFGSGCSWCACSVYITELAPTRIRGMLASLADISINVGILIGYCLDYGVAVAVEDSPNERWRLSMALSATLPVLYILAFPWLPETPRWLTSQGRDKEALQILNTVTCCDADDDPDAVLAELKAAAKTSGGAELRWGDVLCPADSKVRRSVFIAVSLGMVQQATGTEAILYYTPTVLKDDNLSPRDIFYANLAVGGCKLFGELAAAWCVETTGRRPLMVWGNTAMSLAVFGIATSFYLKTTALVTVICLSLVMLTFSLGAGPFTFVVVNEMVPLQYRGKTVAASVFVNRMTSGTVALTFLTIKETIGADNTFFVYGGICVAATIYYSVFVTDTSGISLEQYGASLQRADSPAMSNKSYDTTPAVRAAGGDPEQ